MALKKIYMAAITILLKSMMCLIIPNCPKHIRRSKVPYSFHFRILIKNTAYVASKTGDAYPSDAPGLPSSVEDNIFNLTFAL